MAGVLVTEQSLERTLRQILELACTALPGGDEGGITLLDAEGPGTAVATSDAARRVDNSQYRAETGGPCLDAYRRQQIQRIDSTATDQRWPEFAGTAVTEGIGSTLSIPLVVGGDARTYWRAARLADQLQQTLSTRGVIEQATGILIARHRCSADHAVHLLTAAAQRYRLSLTEVAADLVQRTSTQESQDPQDPQDPPA